MRIVAVGGSDAGISAALRARETAPGAEVTVIAADAYPNFSICGIPYYVSGEVLRWENLAHRTTADLEAAGMMLRLDTTARRIDVADRKVLVTSSGGEEVIGYDQLVIGTGAVPVRPPVTGLDVLGPPDGVHLLHSMSDTFALMRTLEDTAPASAVIVGAGYIGLEMADALITRGLRVTQIEQLPEVLPTVDPDLGALVHTELAARGVEVLTCTAVQAISRSAAGQPGRLRVQAATAAGEPVTRHSDLVLVVVGVRPDTDLAVSAGASLGARGAIAVDTMMRTGLPGIYAAGDCVITRHRLLGDTYLPLGTTAHKQGRVAGENACGGTREFAGSLGTQVVKIFGQAAARTGLRDHEAAAAGYDPVTVAWEADDHKAYYPGSHRIAMRFTGDRQSGKLLGVQLFGSKDAEIAKRIDIAAIAIFHGMTVDAISDLDLSYTPPSGGV
jgi:NADPH-dependent 2,4-dienoyl-CoA reductase/sulfur reductase-like enzyme